MTRAHIKNRVRLVVDVRLHLDHWQSGISLSSNVCAQFYHVSTFHLQVFAVLQRSSRRSICSSFLRTINPNPPPTCVPIFYYIVTFEHWNIKYLKIFSTCTIAHTQLHSQYRVWKCSAVSRRVRWLNEDWKMSNSHSRELSNNIPLVAPPEIAPSGIQIHWHFSKLMKYACARGLFVYNEIIRAFLCCLNILKLIFKKVLQW